MESKNTFVQARTKYNQHGKQSVAAVSEATKVSTSMINDLESNVGKPRNVGYQYIVKLAQHYGVSCDFLLGSSPIPSVIGNEQSAASLDLPDNFINYILFIGKNQSAKKETLKMILSDNRFFEAINAITLTRAVLFQETSDNDDYDLEELESLRKKLFELSGGKQSIVHSSLAVKSLLYSAEKYFSEVAEDCVATFCDIQKCDYPLYD